MNAAVGAHYGPVLSVSGMLRVMCLFRRHKHWERESFLVALASGNSRRCHSCNRLVLKKEFRPSLSDMARWAMEYICDAYEGGPDD